MTLRWTETAADDLEEIYTFLIEESESKAITVVASIVQVIERLERFPNLGRPGREEGTRELIYPPYFIVYRLRHSVVEIGSILHSSRLQNTSLM